ncbi:MAG: hypothetical protein CVU44_08900 [Chloroflexi bacterium HGW-Chloroflexi-6]|nr:MAG: hypothetical protein CVU44_08900 [Chloroflexi bacterium HGW-Chloroflexi-6]
MKLVRVVLGVVLLAFAVVLALLISGFVQDGLLMPVFRFFWLLRGYLGAIPQSALWGFAVIVVFSIALWSLGTVRIAFPSDWTRPQTVPGEVHQLAFWLRRIKRGAYQRWFVARTFADLAIDILRAQGVQVERRGHLSGPGWNPPADIQKYLEIAVYSTPASFGRQAKQAGLETDPEPQAVIEYLETYMMETSNEP